MDGDAGHLVASGASPDLNAITPAHETTSDVATANVTARTATDTTTYVTMGVAAGDGDLLPPRSSGDRLIDAEEWIQEFLDYVEIR